MKKEECSFVVLQRRRDHLDDGGAHELRGTQAGGVAGGCNRVSYLKTLFSVNRDFSRYFIAMILIESSSPSFTTNYVGSSVRIALLHIFLSLSSTSLSPIISISFLIQSLHLHFRLLLLLCPTAITSTLFPTHPVTRCPKQRSLILINSMCKLVLNAVQKGNMDELSKQLPQKG